MIDAQAQAQLLELQKKSVPDSWSWDSLASEFIPAKNLKNR
jgi:hypothetical protein